MTTRTTRALYGSGGAVYAVKESAYTMFILLFYTQVLGLSGSICGLIIGVSLLWDGISDPLVGALSDRFDSRFGRRHPFMVVSTIPMGLGFVGLFYPPADIVENQIYLAGWLLFWSLWVRTFITGFSIPHLALSAEISSDYAERSQILGARMAFLFLAGVLLPAAALTLIFTENDGIDGRFIAGNYPIYGVVSCFVVWIMAAITIVGTRSFTNTGTRPPAVKSTTTGIKPLIRDLARTLGNRTFRLLIGYELSASISYGTVVTLNMLAWTYFWEFSATEISIILAVPSLIGIAAVLLTLGPLSRRFQKYQLLKASLIIIILDMLWLYPLRLTGVLPENGTDTVFWLNFLFMMVFIYCFLLRTISGSSIVADLTDEHELRHGIRQEAAFFSVINFLYKLASIAGPVYSGIVLDIIGLEEGMLPGSVPQPVLNDLVYAMGLGAIPVLLIGLYFVQKIKLNRKDIEAIQSALISGKPDSADKLASP